MPTKDMVFAFSAISIFVFMFCMLAQCVLIVAETIVDSQHPLYFKEGRGVSFHTMKASIRKSRRRLLVVALFFWAASAAYIIFG